MKLSTDLFDLIKSLSKHEKIQIMQGLKTIGHDKKILLLYNAIDKQKVFDEDAIKKKLGYPKWYSNHKNYLTEWINKYLLQSTKYDQLSTQILRLVILGDIYREKGLWKQARKKYDLAYEISNENDRIDFMPLISQKTLSLVEEREEQTEQYDFYLKRYNELEPYYLRKKYQFLFRLIEYTNNTELRERILKLININELLKDEKRLTSYAEKSHFYIFMAGYYRFNNDPQRGYFYTKKCFEVVAAHLAEGCKNAWSLAKLKTILHKYHVTSMNVCLASVMINSLSEADHFFVNFLELESKIAFDKNFATNYNQKKFTLYFILAAVKITRAGVESPDFDSWIKKFQSAKSRMPPRINIQCYEQMSFYFFMQNRWKECQATINGVLNTKMGHSLYQSYFANALLLQLFLNYETNDTDALENNLNKAKRYFTKHIQFLPYEKELLEFFNAATTHINKAERNKIYIEFLKRFNNLKSVVKDLTQPYYSVKTFIDYECWLQSKIEGRLLVEVVKEKAKLVRNQ